ncbi:hypothetical protein [Thioclava pacifica]|uniref:Uncharacterized protein n=1 Tax=Thioclava pacifica DSM 10166 TaxID=1353537 RepID=A0A074J9Z9_9RHOB|nr:hypothetical protein [Thioclava pacifica]KEO54441.1 hypothetical protein TP2_05805 [Thioclava pacifica DSM 10166]
MKRFAFALILSVAGATAASAGIGDFSLPRLDFPGTGSPVVTQGCNDLTQTCADN